MNAPRIESDERGLTINKSLAWAIIVGLVGAGVWVGTENASTKEAIEALYTQQQQRHEETLSYRRDAEGRFRALEASRAADGSEISALRRDLTEFRSELRSLTTLLRTIESGLKQ